MIPIKTTILSILILCAGLPLAVCVAKFIAFLFS